MLANRIALKLVGFFILLGCATSALEAQSGTVTRVMGKGRAKVSWRADGSTAVGQLGIVSDKELAVALVKVLDLKKGFGTIETLDSPYLSVPRKQQTVRLLRLVPPQIRDGESTVLVWSSHVDAPLLVDGKSVGAAPMYLTLTQGSHEVLLKLPEGETAGAKLEAGVGQDEILYLTGRERTVQDNWNPEFLLAPPRKGQVRPKKYLAWIDLADGTRVYMGTGPIRNPKILKQIFPRYPLGADSRPLEGGVALQGIVGTDGRVTQLQVIASKHPELAQAALEAAAQWVYQPGRLNESPVPVLFSVWIDFYPPVK